jgi:patatin-like phospholipase/acyl hydrolase
MVSCLGCLQAVQNTLLACGHGFCSDCIGDLTNNEPLPHYLQHIFCPLDRAPQAFSPRLLPVESGYRILSLDGGGVKGLAQLVMLKRIEEKCFNVPMIYLFDLVVGTSIGGQIALALTIGRPSGPLTVTATKDQFPKLMSHTFAARFPLYRPAPLLFNKTVYKAKRLESQLKDFFGETKLYSVPSMPNMAVTTTVFNPNKEALLVTN